MARGKSVEGNAYLSVEVPRTLLTRAKIRAIKDGVTLKDLVRAAIESYLRESTAS